jgi:hypothetical protein
VGPVRHPENGEDFLATRRAIVPQTRISTWGHKTLRNLAKEYGMTSEQVLDRAIDLLERERLLEAVNAGYAALRADPEAWAEELAERALWETTIGDGLEGY